MHALEGGVRHGGAPLEVGPRVAALRRNQRASEETHVPVGEARQSRAIRFVCPYRAPSMGPLASPVMDASYPLRAQNEPMQTAAVILAAGLLADETLQC